MTIFIVGGENGVGLGTDEWHQAHLAETSKGGGGGWVQGFLQDILQGMTIKVKPQPACFLYV